MYLIFDTETTGLPDNFKAPVSDSGNWPRVVQIAWQLHDEMGRLIEQKDFLIKPEGYNIPYESQQVHGISTELALAEGHDLETVLHQFNQALDQAKFVVGHNVNFDQKVTGAEFYRKGISTSVLDKKVLDTMTEKTAQLCQLPGGRGGRYKLPKLGELYYHLFGEHFAEAHNATADVEATTRAFFELIRRGHFTSEELDAQPGYLEEFKTANPDTIALIGLKHANLKTKSAAYKKKAQAQSKKSGQTDKSILQDDAFAHLHNHTQYSVLQSTTKIDELLKKTVDYQMPAVAITDLNNMMGAFHFVSAVEKYNADKDPSEHLKALVGVELNVVDDHTKKDVKNNGYATVFIAKNKNGYQNLIKLTSVAHTEGFYYVPRIGRDWIEKYKDDLIVLSGALNGEIAQKILNLGDKQAEEAVLWWQKLFGDDYYLELNRHGLEQEEHVNQILLSLADKHQIKVVAANNTYYLEQEDADAQDVLLCIRDNEKKSTPIGRGRGYRYGLPNNEFYFKSPEQMKELFHDIPEAILNIQEVIDKVENFKLKRDVLLPKFDIPEEFKDPEDDKDGGKRGENAYLRHLTYIGAKKRWGELTPEIKERLEFELETIAFTGYPGYFLIVQDIIKEAKKMGVMCGPGRGSAAGSAVAYALGITNVDPIKYQLLFERFLNPERVSLPDIDMDFDDEGREKVIEYVINKYGRERVAQIITYGTMAAKSSIKDAARVTELPLSESERLAKKAHVSLDLILKKDEETIKKKAKR
ncbi:MAG TPA: DNA polymerase III subunit alpha, partial [Flavobacteriales bacterium]|nr:DNA polymerase III subunit alpha [Flavobacteriales bacterium]